MTVCKLRALQIQIKNWKYIGASWHPTSNFWLQHTSRFLYFLYKTWYWYKHKMLRAIAVNCGTFRMIGFLFQKTCKMDAGHENLNKIVVKKMFISPCVWQAPRPNLPSVRQASYRDLPSSPEVESPHAWAIWNLRQTKSKDRTQNQCKRSLEIFKDYWKFLNLR